MAEPNVPKMPSREWMREKIANDPDFETEARPAPDQTNAEVSDERLRELLPCPFCGARLEQIVGTKGIYSCPTEGCYTRDIGVDTQSSDDVAAWNRRSVTSQASEGAGWKLVPIKADMPMHAAGQEVVWKGGARPGPVQVHVTTGTFGEIWAAMLAAAPASPVSKRVERLETALTDVLREATTAKPFGSHTLPPDLIARLQALQGGRS